METLTRNLMPELKHSRETFISESLQTTLKNPELDPTVKRWAYLNFNKRVALAQKDRAELEEAFRQFIADLENPAVVKQKNQSDLEKTSDTSTADQENPAVVKKMDQKALWSHMGISTKQEETHAVSVIDADIWKLENCEENLFDFVLSHKLDYPNLW